VGIERLSVGERPQRYQMVEQLGVILDRRHPNLTALTLAIAALANCPRIVAQLARHRLQSGANIGTMLLAGDLIGRKQRLRRN
jgi:hypothetical protein